MKKKKSPSDYPQINLRPSKENKAWVKQEARKVKMTESKFVNFLITGKRLGWK